MALRFWKVVLEGIPLSSQSWITERIRVSENNIYSCECRPGVGIEIVRKEHSTLDQSFEPGSFFQVCVFIVPSIVEI